MKSILVATAALLICALWSTIVLRRRGPNVWALFTGFFAAFPVLVLIHLVTPEDLFFLSSQFVNPHPTFDLGFAIFLYAAGFFGGLLQLYNLAERGFSLRILMDAAEARCERVTVARVMSDYSAGKGIGWMYQKRINDMVRAGLVTQHGERIDATARGARVAAVFAWVRARLHFPPP